jgi:hypothetical protein
MYAPRRILTLLLVATLPTTVALVAPVAGSSAAPAPVRPATTTVALLPVTQVPDAASSTSTLGRSRVAAGPTTRVVLATKPVAVTAELSVAGVTWSRGSGDAASVEYRTATRGAWGAWRALGSDEEHAPDPGTREARSARDGSDPLVVTGADRLQMRVLTAASSAPLGAELTMVDPGRSKADAVVGAQRAGAAAAAVTTPVIYSRAQWGADESLRDPSGPDYGSVKAAFVHHTTDSNGYTSSQVPGLIRGIYAVHVNGRGWSDIGYNFLVDRFGRTWEGRYGGTTLPVIGAHTANVNSYSFGVSAIGNFDVANPPTATVTAIKRLVAWKAQIHEFNPRGKANVGTTIVNAVSGHRDAVQTACPGRYLYAQVPAIRASAVDQLRGLPSLSLDRDLDNHNNADVVATNAHRDLLLYPTTNQGTLGTPVTLGSGSWAGVDQVHVAGDLTGDGAADLVARATATGELRLYPATGTGGLRSGRAIGSGWSVMSAIIAPGDWNGDGRPDLLARLASDNSLRLYPGNGAGGFGRALVVGTGWGGMRLVSGVGDWDADGAPDLLAVATNGSARIYRGSGTGGFRGYLNLTGDWSSYTSVVGVGDATWDTRVDVLAVTSDGQVRLGRVGSTVSEVRWTQLRSSLNGVEVYSG